MGWAVRCSNHGRCNIRLFFAFSGISTTAVGPIQFLIQWIPRFIHGGNRPKREAEHSYPSSDEGKNVWSYISTPPYTHLWLYLILILGAIWQI